MSQTEVYLPDGQWHSTPGYVTGHHLGKDGAVTVESLLGHPVPVQKVNRHHEDTSHELQDMTDANLLSLISSDLDGLGEAARRVLALRPCSCTSRDACSCTGTALEDCRCYQHLLRGDS